MQPMRQSLPILLACVSIACAVVAAEPAEKVSAETIAKWIEQLDSNTYIERERATIGLEHIGIAAIEALAKAADGNRLEVATRAVRVLLKYSEHDDAKLSQAALESIATLKNRPVESAAAQAMLGALRKERALAEVLRLGGTKDEDRAVFDGFGPGRHLKIGPGWKGGDAGFEQVGHLQALLTLNIHATPITDKALAHLKDLKSLVDIKLYGTNVTVEGVESLKNALPHVDIQQHRVFLGVKGRSLLKITKISEVVPGSTAEKAGIQPGDVITKFGGQIVTDFQSLTNHIASHKPGDTVVVELIRNDQAITKEITFGSQR